MQFLLQDVIVARKWVLWRISRLIRYSLKYCYNSTRSESKMSMIKLLDKVSLQGTASLNEDAFASKDNFIALVDGATNVHEEGFSPQTFAQTLANNLVKHHNSSKPMAALILQVLQEIQRSYAKEKLKEKLYPSASMLTVELKDNLLTFHSLGDCTALIKLTDKSIIRLHDDKVTQLDEELIAKVKAIALEENIPIKNARNHITELLKVNRQKQNAIGGYWIAEPTGKGVSALRKFSIEASLVKTLALMTDGFVAYQNINGFNDYEFLTAIKLFGAKAISHRIAQVYAKDADWSTFPRLKERDDATCLVLEVDH